MNLIKKIAVGAFLLLTSLSALGDILDCTRPISGIFTGNSGCYIYVEYKDGFSSACMTPPDAGNDPQIINRTLGVMLAGYIAGKTVTIRYSGGVDGSPPSCTPTAWQRITGAFVR